MYDNSLLPGCSIGLLEGKQGRAPFKPNARHKQRRCGTLRTDDHNPKVTKNEVSCSADAGGATICGLLRSISGLAQALP